MRSRRVLILFASLPLSWHACGLAHGQPPQDTAPGPAPVRVTLDTSEVPELAPWGEEAKALVEKWHPIVADLLRSDGFTPPVEVRLVFRKDSRYLAETSGTTIQIAASWVRSHPDDWGMVIHELAHVIQSYPRARAGWLVEGIADYIRFYHFEPQTRLAPIDPDRDRYRDGYRTTAQFLAWIVRTHDPAIVHKLNEALRHSRYSEEIFRQSTSRSLDELWDEFAKDPARGAGDEVKDRTGAVRIDDHGLRTDDR